MFISCKQGRSEMEKKFQIKGQYGYQVYKDGAKFHFQEVERGKWKNAGIFLACIMVVFTFFEGNFGWMAFFICFGILDVVVRYWSEVSYAKRMYTAAKKLDDPKAATTFYDKEIIVEAPEIKMQIQYHQFARCYETERYFYFYYENKVLAMIIEKASLTVGTPADLKKFLIKSGVQVIEK